jgi:hypothetical protein
MAQRGMGLTAGDFLDLMQTYLRREKRTNPFTNDRPGYGWYYAFMARNVTVLEKRKEVPLEASRAKVTPLLVDTWFDQYRTFLSGKHMLDTPHLIWNADESGFTMGSKPGSVIGPSRQSNPEPVPHLSGGSTKQRLTVMFCGNAEAQMMPPFFVYPQPKPTAYDPMLGSARGSTVVYTNKGWMNAANFSDSLSILIHMLVLSALCYSSLTVSAVTSTSMCLLSHHHMALSYIELSQMLHTLYNPWTQGCLVL